MLKADFIKFYSKVRWADPLMRSFEEGYACHLFEFQTFLCHNFTTPSHWHHNFNIKLFLLLLHVAVSTLCRIKEFYLGLMCGVFKRLGHMVQHCMNIACNG